MRTLHINRSAFARHPARWLVVFQATLATLLWAESQVVSAIPSWHHHAIVLFGGVPTYSGLNPDEVTAAIATVAAVSAPFLALPWFLAWVTFATALCVADLCCSNCGGTTVGKSIAESVNRARAALGSTTGPVASTKTEEYP